jgi:DNA-binding response OmpR family regulator
MKARILIVEDNVDLLKILRDVLSTEYEVTAVRRGEDAIALATELRPALVILDLGLPSMDGIETGRWLKQTLGASVRILVLTASAADGDPKAVLASGCCDAYMAKPAPLAEIRREVGRLLNSAVQSA